MKIQFSVPWVKEVTHEGRPAFARAHARADACACSDANTIRLTAPVGATAEMHAGALLPRRRRAPHCRGAGGGYQRWRHRQ
ncbi:MAG: flagellar brake protein [Comamonadaceae bacterium]|nr:flagellar brake protein [Comamonadaceae bacterium]